MQIAVTLLSAYLYCKRKLFLERVLKLVEVPKEAIVLGSIRHITYDKINLAEKHIILSLGRPNQEYIFDSYKKRYSSLLRASIIEKKIDLGKVKVPLPEAFKRAWKHILNEAEARTQNVYEFSRKTGLLGTELWEALTPKIKSEYKISSNTLELVGVIDQIEISRENIIPVELKTGKAPDDGLWPSHRIQLAAYLMLIEEEFSKQPEYGKVRYLDVAQDRKLTMNPFLKEEVTNLRDKVKELLNSTELPKQCENKNKCASCGLKKQCYDDTMLKEKMESIK